MDKAHLFSFFRKKYVFFCFLNVGINIIGLNKGHSLLLLATLSGALYLVTIIYKRVSSTFPSKTSRLLKARVQMGS